MSENDKREIVRDIALIAALLVAGTCMKIMPRFGISDTTAILSGILSGVSAFVLVVTLAPRWK
jgi:hypothetical protein